MNLHPNSNLYWSRQADSVGAGRQSSLQGKRTVVPLPQGRPLSALGDCSGSVSEKLLAQVWATWIDDAWQRDVGLGSGQTARPGLHPLLALASVSAAVAYFLPSIIRLDLYESSHQPSSHFFGADKPCSMFMTVLGRCKQLVSAQHKYRHSQLLGGVSLYQRSPNVLPSQCPVCCRYGTWLSEVIGNDAICEDTMVLLPVISRLQDHERPWKQQ